LPLTEPDEGRIPAVAVSADGKLLAAGGVGRNDRGNLVPVLWLFDTATGKRSRSLEGHRGWVGAAAFSPDGKLLASGDDKREVLVWESATGKLSHRLRGHSGAGALAFSPDGTVLASAENGPPNPGLCLWEVGTGKLLRRFPRGYCNTSSLAFSPDGRMVTVASGEQDLGVWEVATGQKRLTLSTRGKGWVRGVAFSPDGTLLAAGAGDDVHLWDLWSGRWLGRFVGHRGPVRSLAFGAGGKSLISGSGDTTALVWDVGRLGRAGTSPRPGLTNTPDQQFWEALAGPDAGKAYGAMCALVADPPRAVALLRGRLRPVAAPPARQRGSVARLIRDLDDDDFAARERASRQLEQLGEAVEPALRLSLQRAPSAEVRRRLNGLLGALADRRQGPDGLRELRSVEVLERLGTPEARRLLEALATGVPPARLTREATASLARLGKHGRRP
jgi:hypothetical protein